MVTLISEVTSGGKRRSCNARCYNAKRDVCVCVCSHQNHGVGQKQATENTERMQGIFQKDFVAQGVLSL